MIQKDHGHAWVVLIAAIGINLVFGFLVFNTGLLTNALLDTLDVSLFQASWVGSSFVGIVLMGGPITGIYHRKVGARKASITAGVVCCAGLVLSSFMESIVGLLCSFGLVTGLGFSLAVNVVFSIPGHYFVKRKSFAFAIMMAASGVGSFPGSFLFTYLLEEFFFSGTLLILGSITLHICIAAMLFVDVDEESRLQDVQSANLEIRPTIVKVIELDNGTYKDHTKATTLCCNMKKKTFFILLHNCVQFFKMKAFVVFLAGVLFWGIGESASFLHLPNYVISKGSTPWEASTVISTIGITMIFSKIFGGLLGSDPTIGYYIPFSGMNGLAGVLNTLLPLMSHTFQLQCLYAVLFGLQFGGPNSFISLIAIDLVGRSDIEIGMGFVTLFYGTGYLIGPPLASWVFSLTGSYDNTFILAGAALLLSSTCVIMIPSLKNKEEHKSDTKEIIVSSLVTERL